MENLFPRFGPGFTKKWLTTGLRRFRSGRDRQIVDQPGAAESRRGEQPRRPIEPFDGLQGLGVAYSTGTHGLDVDLIEAHKWFNLAALNGNALGQMCRAEISEEMTAREIAEAQRQARAWLAETGMRRAA